MCLVNCVRWLLHRNSCSKLDDYWSTNHCQVLTQIIIFPHQTKNNCSQSSSTFRKPWPSSNSATLTWHFGRIYREIQSIFHVWWSWISHRLRIHFVILWGTRTWGVRKPVESLPSPESLPIPALPGEVLSWYPGTGGRSIPDRFWPRRGPVKLGSIAHKYFLIVAVSLNTASRNSKMNSLLNRVYIILRYRPMLASLPRLVSGSNTRIRVSVHHHPLTTMEGCSPEIHKLTVA